MRLVDQIGEQQRFVIGSERLGETFRVQTAADFSLKLQATPHRFILDRAATQFCTEFSVLEADMLAASMDILRFPAHRFWIEWMERPRLDTLASLRPGLYLDRAEVPTQTRAGALVEINSDGHSGKAWLFISGETGADLYSVNMEFDTRDAPQVDPTPAPARFNFACRDFPELDQVMRHCAFNVERSWYDYLRAAISSDCEFSSTVTGMAAKVMLDWPMIATFSLLYPLPKPFSQRHSDLAKLNHARQSKGQSALLEHVEVTASLGAGARYDPANDGSGGGNARGKRLHHVRGHLVRRGDRVFWRSPHLRGKPELGEVMTRTVRVTA